MRRVPQSTRRLVSALCVCLVALWAAPVAAQDGESGLIHEVAWGENLFRIALRYGVTVDSIVRANGLSGPDSIYAGQRLVIPGGSGDPGPALPGVGTGGTHVVGPGENLFRIGLLYGLTVDQMMAANNLSDPNAIYAGQTLVVPGVTSGSPSSASAASAPSSEPEPTPPAGTYVVAPGETLFRIAQRYQVSVKALTDANQLANPGHIYAGQVLTIPGAAASSAPGYTPAQAARTHVVQPGETLSSIARRYGVSVWTLTQVNNLSNPSLLYAGQTLNIPEASALSQPGQAPSDGGKRIVIDVSDQRLYAYQGDQLIWTFVVSTGIPSRPTAIGNFHVQDKLPMAYASTWDLQMPNWLGIYWAGPLQNGIHALPILSNGARMWANALGRPASYGCIILGVQEAETLYNWAEIGTPVSIVP
jgi:LysM repeat protein